MFEEAVPRGRDAEVALQLLVDVDQARRRSDALADREAQAVGLARPVIGILPQDDDPHLFQRSQVERPEPLAAGREDALARLLLADQPAPKRAHVIAVELAFERLQPTRVQLHLAHAGFIVRRALARKPVRAPAPDLETVRASPRESPRRKPGPMSRSGRGSAAATSSHPHTPRSWVPAPTGQQEIRIWGRPGLSPPSRRRPRRRRCRSAPAWPRRRRSLAPERGAWSASIRPSRARCWRGR